MIKEAAKRIELFFIHPRLYRPVETYGKAVALMYALLATTLISSFYGIYYELNHSPIPLVKHLADIIAVIYCPIGLLILKYRGKIELTILAMLAAASTLVFLSTYYCGGIYALDLFWMTIICIVGVLFIGKKGGIFLVTLALVYIGIFYGLDRMGFKNFKIESEVLGVNYTMYNLFFLLGLASFISYFFVDGAQKVKQKLDEMKEREVMDLDTKYRYMTENVDEIISLHLAHGDSTYISPSLKIILGYESHELLGLRYFTLLGGNFIDKEISCLTKEGKEVWLEITFAPIVDEIGSGEVYISMAKDISEKVWENQRISQLRKQIANDFHDEMGNKLASITLNSNILSLMVVENERQKNIIQKIESTSNALYQHSRDFIWSIDPKSDHLREIFSYLRDFGDDYFQNSEMNFRIDSLGFSEQENIVLPMYWGRHIVLIFKEIMAVIRLGVSNRNIELALEVNESKIVISLRDDGKSVEELERKKLALSGMGPRAEIIQGELKMESFSRGNKISLILKLPNLGGRIIR